MLIKIFSRSASNGNRLLNYLFSEHSHESYKPELIEGNRELTKNIINNISNKHKYVAGCISFAKDEILTVKQQKELINNFEKTFAPFKDEGRVNFLWVRHLDKGRLELNFVVPRIDLKTQKAFNLHPPGKANQLFFNTWTRLQNEKHGFKQIDKEIVNSFEIRLSMTVLKDLHEQRKDYISRVFDKETKAHNNINYDRTRATNPAYKQSHTKLRKLNTSIVKSSVVSTFSTKRNDEKPTITTRANSQEFESIKHLSNNFKSNANEIKQLFGQRGKLSNSTRTSQINTNGLSIEEQIRQLSLSLNDCDPAQSFSIISQLNVLQGQLSRQQAPRFKK